MNKKRSNKILCEDDKENYNNATRKENILKNTTSIDVKSNKIYTSEIIEEIKEVADGILTTKQLKLIFQNKYPNLNITTGNFNNIIVRHKIPHARKRAVSDIEDVNLINLDDNIEDIKSINLDDSTEDVIIPENMEISKEISIEEEPLKENSINKDVDEDGDPIRLRPIKQEVVSVLDSKFKEKNCRNQFNYTVDDYIKMLEMFEYLAGNIDSLIKCRDTQINIVNDYQFDIVHEMENELAEEGNTYLQDKMYVMRDYRRYMEVDYRALTQLRPILKLIRGVIHPSNPNNPNDLKSISGCSNVLKQIITENAQPKFVPRVDIGMIKKYDWAVNRNSVYKKAVIPQVNEINNNEEEDIYDLGKKLDEIDKQIKQSKPMRSSIPIQDRNIKINASLRSLKSNIKLTDEEVAKGFSIFRVSCRISGGTYGVFRPWYKDYSCIKKEMAMAFAQQEFAKLKSKNGQLLFTEIECHKLNEI